MAGFEIKSHGFYMTVSGNHLEGTPGTIEDRQTELMDLYKEIFGKEGLKPLTIGERREKPEKRTDGVDISACEFAVCCDLCKAGMSDEEIDQLLMGHPLMPRSKWQDRPDYRKKTIQAARKSFCGDAN